MPKIISANYLDRDSEYKWLIRDAEQKPEEARACKYVEASGVKFKETGRGNFPFEAGFGCGIVAITEQATAQLISGDSAIPEIDIQFPAGRLSTFKYQWPGVMYDSLRNQVVKEADYIVLTPEGSSLYVPKASAPVESEAVPAGAD